MATSADYLSSLLTLAKSATEARKQAEETKLKQGASGTFAADASGRMVYTPGTEGSLDVGYQRGSRNLEGGLESRGILRSGEGATSRGNLLTDYQTAAMNLYNTTESNKTAFDKDYLQAEAEYKMKYGTGREPTGAPEAVNTVPPSLFQPQPDGTYAPQVNEQTQAAAIALGSPMGTYNDPRFQSPMLKKKPAAKKPAAVAKPAPQKPKPAPAPAPAPRRTAVRAPVSRMVG